MNAIIVTGDRYAVWDDWKDVIIDMLHTVRPKIVIHGACGVDASSWQLWKMKGIDALVHDSPRPHGTVMIPVPAPFAREGVRGGPLRNGKMLDMLQDLAFCGYDIEVHAFHDNLSESRGTRDMIKQAQRAGVRVVIHTSSKI